MAYVPEGFEPEAPRPPTLNEETDDFIQEQDMRQRIIPGTEVPEPEEGNDVAYVPEGFEPELSADAGGVANDNTGDGFGNEVASDALVFNGAPEGFEPEQPLPFQGTAEGFINVAKGMTNLNKAFQNWLVKKGTQIFQNMEKAVYPANEEEQIQAVTQLMTDFSTVGFTRAATSGVKGAFGTIDELGMFGGKMSTRPGLDIAEQAWKEGQDPELVKKATGWYKNEAGQPEYVIDPKKLTLKPEPRLISTTDRQGRATFITPLSDVLDHPQLYNDFPELGSKAFVKLDPNLPDGEAQYSLVNGLHMITVNANTHKSSWLTSMTHEINHALQEINDLPRGADFVQIAKQARQALNDLADGARPDQLDFPILDAIRRQYPRYNPTDEQIVQFIRKTKDEYSGDWASTVANLSQNIGRDMYKRSAGEVKSRLAGDLLHLSDGEIAAMDMAKAGDVPVRDRIFDFDPQSGPGSLSTDWNKGRDINPGRPANENHPLFKWAKDTLSEMVPGAEKKIADPVDYLKKLESTELASMVSIRSKQQVTRLDSEIGKLSDPRQNPNPDRDMIADLRVLRRYYKDVETTSKELIKMKPGNERDSLRRYVDGKLEQIGKMEADLEKKMIPQQSQQQQGKIGSSFPRPPDWKPGGNTPTNLTHKEYIITDKSGTPVGSADSLEAAKKSVDKRDNAQGSYGHRFEKTSDYLDKKWDEVPQKIKESMMQAQQSQQQQSNAGNWSKGKEGWQKSTTGATDRRMVELRKEGMGLEEIVKVLNEGRKEKLLDPITFATVQRRMAEWKKSDDYKEFTKDKVFKQRQGWVSNKPEPKPVSKKAGRPRKRQLEPKLYGLFKDIDFKE